MSDDLLRDVAARDTLDEGYGDAIIALLAERDALRAALTEALDHWERCEASSCTDQPQDSERIIELRKLVEVGR